LVVADGKARRLPLSERNSRIGKFQESVRIQADFANSIVIRYKGIGPCLEQMRNSELTHDHYRALADFRYQIRRFLHFSEDAARQEGLEPQQHQMLLAIWALTGAEGPTIGKLAAHLLVRHHSAVGLIDRLAGRGLVERTRNAQDRRQVQVQLTEAGEVILRHLTGIHREELRKSGPLLVHILSDLLRRSHTSATRPG
jgi:DNA-binding MarR family transcriptional regulator